MEKLKIFFSFQNYIIIFLSFIIYILQVTIARRWLSAHAVFLSMITWLCSALECKDHRLSIGHIDKYLVRCDHS